uniref:RxLR effector protein n=1 Tax=Peronospora matthiolae TaxID=2874970 RepID=A0AAV1TIV4_9STRA
MKKTLTHLAVAALILPATSSRSQSSTTALLDGPATASDSDPSNSAKSLRLAAPTVEEDRTWFEPDLLWFKTKLWSALGKSDEEIREMLGMKGLTETGLTTHKNYKLYKKIRDSRLLDGWSSKGRMAHDVWEELQLHKVSPELLEHSEDFKLYKQYLMIEDDSIWKRMDDDGVKKWDEREGKEELNAKVEIWKLAKRKPWYVQSRLNLHQNRRECMGQPNFDFYRRYLDETHHFLSTYYNNLETQLREAKEANEKRIAALTQRKRQTLRTWPAQSASGTLSLTKQKQKRDFYGLP